MAQCLFVVWQFIDLCLQIDKFRCLVHFAQMQSQNVLGREFNKIQIIKYSSMIRDQNDPTGCGLFSRCARNQASKVKKTRPHTANSRKVTQKASNLSLKKKIMPQSTFQRQESRDQRQRKYKQQVTPAVGQYNPHLKPKAKMIWDILKVYHTQNRQKQSAEVHKCPPKPEIIKSVKQITQVQKQKKSIVQLDRDREELIQSRAIANRQKTQNSLSKSQCIVNMSRMTGRKLDMSREQPSIGEHNISRSINYIKGKIVTNINFDKQTVRGIDRLMTLNPGNTYSYNYDVIRPKRKGIVGFGKLKGRQEKQDPLKTQYSYAHYEYDDYVWQRNSNIFPNTKTHLINFDKQSSRYQQFQQE